MPVVWEIYGEYFTTQWLAGYSGRPYFLLSRLLSFIPYPTKADGSAIIRVRYPATFSTRRGNASINLHITNTDEREKTQNNSFPQGEWCKRHMKSFFQRFSHTLTHLQMIFSLLHLYRWLPLLHFSLRITRWLNQGKSSGKSFGKVYYTFRVKVVLT